MPTIRPFAITPYSPQLPKVLFWSETFFLMAVVAMSDEAAPLPTMTSPPITWILGDFDTVTQNGGPWYHLASLSLCGRTESAYHTLLSNGASGMIVPNPLKSNVPLAKTRDPPPISSDPKP